MVKGYEFEKDKFVLFQPDELKTLEEGSDHVIDIVAFVPQKSIDPIYYDKAYMLAPDKRGGKPYALLMEAMRQSNRCALARWSWKAKRHVVQVRPAEDGLMLQQLYFADEVRSLKDLNIEKVDVTQAELDLAMQLIDQIAEESYDPHAFKDEEKQRILAAIDRKICRPADRRARRSRVAGQRPGDRPDGSAARQPRQARRRGQRQCQGHAGQGRQTRGRAGRRVARQRKGVRRAVAAEAAAPAPVRARAKK